MQRYVLQGQLRVDVLAQLARGRLEARQEGVDIDEGVARRRAFKLLAAVDVDDGSGAASGDQQRVAPPALPQLQRGVDRRLLAATELLGALLGPAEARTARLAM